MTEKLGYMTAATTRTRSKPYSLQLVTTAINAALYAGVGALWVAFPITVFGIRFWPQVFVPGAFSVLFGPWTGGIGAAIGIFLADVVYGHHDALLSLLVGVPSNFVGFFLLGWLANRSLRSASRHILLVLSLLFPIILVVYGFYMLAGPSVVSSSQYLVAVVGLIAVLVIVGVTILRNRWADFEMAASVGLGVGSVIIGIGIVAYSTIFTLPSVLGLGNGVLPISFMYGATAFTYLSEIPFLVLLTPPVVAAARAAFPALRLSGAQTEPLKQTVEQN